MWTCLSATLIPLQVTVWRGPSSSLVSSRYIFHQEKTSSLKPQHNTSYFQVSSLEYVMKQKYEDSVLWSVCCDMKKRFRLNLYASNITVFHRRLIKQIFSWLVILLLRVEVQRHYRNLTVQVWPVYSGWRMDDVVVYVGEYMESEACQSTPLNCPPLLKPNP